MNEEITRCWNSKNPLYTKYHDEEWGVPVHNDIKLFEFLTLGGFQAGLTWELVLNKRDAFRKSFDNFDPKKIALYTKKKIKNLMNNPAIIRNRAKILATVHNARLVLDIQKEYGSFDTYIWRFSNGRRVNNTFKDFADLPTESDESRVMSNKLKKKGFKFVGPTICYAFMQAVGMVNDHLVQCFRHGQIKKMKIQTGSES